MSQIYTVDTARAPALSAAPESLNTARGIVIGVGISAAFWVAILTVIF